MGVWTAIIAGLFIYVGGTYLLNNIVTGTSVGEDVVTTVVPVVLGVSVVGILWKVFT